MQYPSVSDPVWCTVDAHTRGQDGDKSNSGIATAQTSLASPTPKLLSQHMRTHAYTRAHAHAHTYLHTVWSFFRRASVRERILVWLASRSEKTPSNTITNETITDATNTSNTTTSAIDTTFNSSKQKKKLSRMWSGIVRSEHQQKKRYRPVSLAKVQHWLAA
jgi:hypothetical protein